MNVMDLLLQRRKENSQPLKRNDNFKVGLAIEGGGMRGIVSAGMLTSLADLGLTDSFDAVYGSSAGSINGAYFISKQAPYGTSIYYNEANTNNFISWLRLLKNKSPMQLGYLINIFKNVKILDWEAIINSGIEFNILASSLDREKVVSLKNFQKRDEMMLALQAGACIPWFAGEPVFVNGERFIDASFFESIPYQFAVEDGCTHVLALRTRPFGVSRDNPTLLERIVLKSYFKKHGPKFYDYYFDVRWKKYNSQIKSLESGFFQDIPTTVPIDSIAMRRGSAKVSQLEKRKDILQAGAVNGYKATLQKFGVCDCFLVDVLRCYNSTGRPICNNC